MPAWSPKRGVEPLSEVHQHRTEPLLSGTENTALGLWPGFTTIAWGLAFGAPKKHFPELGFRTLKRSDSPHFPPVKMQCLVSIFKQKKRKDLVTFLSAEPQHLSLCFPSENGGLRLLGSFSSSPSSAPPGLQLALWPQKAALALPFPPGAPDSQQVRTKRFIKKPARHHYSRTLPHGASTQDSRYGTGEGRKTKRSVSIVVKK